ncbi:ornithine decarboxylase [Edwardsiella piscicida C07-087]|nr:ornithine decarboxylase [Edwardsiella piscicida C07-087]
MVLSVQDALGGALDKVEQSAFGLPVFVAEACDQRLPAEYLPRLTGVFACGAGRDLGRLGAALLPGAGRGHQPAAGLRAGAAGGLHPAG